jgi:hypothetical protein
MEAENSHNSQSNPEQKEQCWRITVPIQIILQSRNNKNSTVLT